MQFEKKNKDYVEQKIIDLDNGVEKEQINSKAAMSEVMNCENPNGRNLILLKENSKEMSSQQDTNKTPYLANFGITSPRNAFN